MFHIFILGDSAWYFTIPKRNQVMGYTYFGRAFSHTIAQYAGYKNLDELIDLVIYVNLLYNLKIIYKISILIIIIHLIV